MSRVLPLGALAAICFPVALAAQDSGNYREFVLGSSVQAVTTLAATGASPVQTTTQRPALIQTLMWRRPYVSTDNQPALRDPVKEIEFSFYDDQLYRIMVDYEPDRTRGLTTPDFVDALSATYGPTRLTPARPSSGARSEDDVNAGRVIGQWGDGDVSITAYQQTDIYAGPAGLRFKLIVTSARLSALSRTALASSARQDEREAPQREIERRKKQAADQQQALEKARVANKAAFKP